MRCATTQDAMSALLDGELDARTEQALRGHLGSCTSCRARWQRLEALDRRTRIRTAESVPDLSPAVLALTARRPPTRSAGRPLPRSLRFAPAAAFALVLSAGLLVGRAEGQVTHGVPAPSAQALQPEPCADPASPGQGAAGAPSCNAAGRAGSSATVVMRHDSFAPTSLVVVAGSTVDFVNADRDTHHLVRAVAGGELSATLRSGETDAVTYTTPGTYHFSCTVHPGMVGVVTVLE